jgi:hypothetical protein
MNQWVIREDKMDKDVEGFVDYLIKDITKEQLAVLYYQALESTAQMLTCSSDEGEEITYNELHDANIDFMASVINDNNSTETRQ